MTGKMTGFKTFLRGDLRVALCLDIFTLCQSSSVADGAVRAKVSAKKAHKAISFFDIPLRGDIVLVCDTGGCGSQ